jgi:hypothetical protein
MPLQRELFKPELNDMMRYEDHAMMQDQSSKIEVIEVTDPVEIARAQRQDEQFDRNSAWLQAHINEAYDNKNRGKCICIAGQELFVADTVEEAVTQARAAHPEDEGWFTRYVPKVKAAMIYAILDRPADVVVILGGNHHYAIHQR